MPVGMSAVVVLLSMALVLSMSLPSEAAGSSTAGLSKWGSGLQTRIRAGERRLLSNSTTNYTTTSANSMVTTAATTTTTPAPTAKKFEVKFTVSLPYSKADFTMDMQTKFKEVVVTVVASVAGYGATKDDVSLKITVSHECRRCRARLCLFVHVWLLRTLLCALAAVRVHPAPLWRLFRLVAEREGVLAEINARSESFSRSDDELLSE